MKKKQQNILLLSAVIFVWGWICVKIYNNLSGNDDSHRNIDTIVTGKNDTLQSDYEIHTYNRDPFLSILTDTVTVQEIDTAKKQKLILSPPKPVSLPTYYGYIVTGKSRTAILKFDNKKTIFLKEKEKYNDFRLVFISSDSVILLSGNDRFCLHISSQKKQDQWQLTKNK